MVERRRSGISPAKSSLDLAKIVVNVGVEGGGGRFVRGDSTCESIVKSTFPPGDPNREFQAALAATRIENHHNLGLGFFVRAH